MTNKKINNYFEQESGRSMVEMLGVLAIIGVLSVGGVAGYKLAMDKHKANEMMEELYRRAAALAQMAQNGTTLSAASLDEFESQIGDAYAVEVIPDTGYYDEFGIRIKDLPKNMCKMVMNLQWDAILEVTGDKNCDKESNTLEFAFADDLTSRVGSASSCPQGSTQNEDGKTCDKNGKKVCTDNTNCATNQYCKVVVNDHHHFDDCSMGDGECKDLGTSDSHDSFVWSITETMNWYSAQNWCKAKGKTLSSPTSYQRSDNPVATLITGKVWLTIEGSHYSCIATRSEGSFVGNDDIDKEYHALCE